MMFIETISGIKVDKSLTQASNGTPIDDEMREILE